MENCLGAITPTTLRKGACPSCKYIKKKWSHFCRLSGKVINNKIIRKQYLYCYYIFDNKPGDSQGLVLMEETVATEAALFLCLTVPLKS